MENLILPLVLLIACSANYRPLALHEGNLRVVEHKHLCAPIVVLRFTMFCHLLVLPSSVSVANSGSGCA